MWGCGSVGRGRPGELLFALEQLACRRVPIRRRAGAAHRGQGLKAAAAGVSRGSAEDRGSRRRHGRCWRSAGDRCAGSPSDGHEGLYAAAVGRAGSAPHAAAAQRRAGYFGRSQAGAGDQYRGKRAVPRRAADKEAPRAASGRARSAGSKGPRAKREGNRCEREAVCAGASGEPFEIAGHVQRRLREGGAALALRSHGCADGARGRGVPCGSRLPFHQHHHAL